MNKNKLLRCMFCGERFETFTELNHHYEREHRGQYVTNNN